MRSGDLLPFGPYARQLFLATLDLDLPPLDGRRAEKASGPGLIEVRAQAFDFHLQLGLAEAFVLRDRAKSRLLLLHLLQEGGTLCRRGTPVLERQRVEPLLHLDAVESIVLEAKLFRERGLLALLRRLLPLELGRGLLRRGLGQNQRQERENHASQNVHYSNQISSS
jgi:hypothetical protein